MNLHSSLVCLTLLPVSLFGQWELGVMAGGGAGRIRTDLYPATSRGEYQVVDHRFTWCVGGTLSHALSRLLQFSTGLHWSFIAGHDEHWHPGVMIRSTDRAAHYLCLPMMVDVSLWRFRIGTGFQVATPLIERGTFRTFPSANGYGTPTSEEVDDIGLKHTDFGAVASIDIQLTKLTQAGLRYYHGLQDVKDHTDGLISPLMNQQLVLTFGYRILPKRKPKAKEAPVEPMPTE